MSDFSRVQPDRGAFAWYMTSQFIWFFVMGIQFVAFQAIAALELELSAGKIGLAQSTILLPSLIFMLAAGVAAERHDSRLLLIRLQLAAALPPCALAILVLTKHIDLSGLIIYGLLMGTISAFTMPTRDMLVSYIVTPSEIQRAVTMATGLQFMGNLVGMAIVGVFDHINIGWLVMLQSALLILAASATHRLPYQLAPAQQGDDLLAKRRMQIIDGMRYALADNKIMPTLVMMFAMSIFYMGTFFVFFPLIVRDYYQGGTADIAAANALFWAGMIFASAVLVKIGLVRRLGRLLVAAAISGLIVLLLFSIPGPFWWLLTLTFIWGCGGGVFMASSRTIIQSRAPDAYRGRLLSIYQLSFMGGAPVGALGFGFLADITPSLHITPLAPMICMLIVVSFVCFLSDILSIRLDAHGKIL